MTADADTLVARRRLRRKLSFWRVAAVLLAAIVIVALGVTGARDGGGFAFGDQVARVRIQGFISGDQSTLDLFDAIEKAGRVKGVILHVDSPGGTTVGAEALYEAVRKVAEKKPVVAVMDTVAASGGYATAAAADHIVARGNTITGSIGVIFQWPDVSKLMETVGVKMEEIKSGELKAEPTPFKPPSDKVRAVSMEMVRDSFDWFTGLVAERRRLPLDQVRLLSDGRVYTGRQALEGQADRRHRRGGQGDPVADLGAPGAERARHRRLGAELGLRGLGPRHVGGANHPFLPRARRVGTVRRPRYRRQSRAA